MYLPPRIFKVQLSIYATYKLIFCQGCEVLFWLFQGIEVLHSLHWTSTPCKSQNRTSIKLCRTSNSLCGFYIDVGKLDLDNYFWQLGNLGNWIWAIWVKHSLQTDLTHTVTLNANTQEIITLQIVCSLI